MKKFPWILLGMAMMAIPVAVATTGAFTDVSEGDYFYSAVQNLKDMKIVKGYGDGTFKPKNNISRAEMAVMMDRMADATRKGCVSEDGFSKYGFDDQYDDENGEYIVRKIFLSGDYVGTISENKLAYKFYCSDSKLLSKEACLTEKYDLLLLGETDPSKPEVYEDYEECKLNKDTGFAELEGIMHGDPV